METLLLFVPFLIPVVTAQYGERKRWAFYATYGLLIAINLFLLGVVALALFNQLATVMTPGLLESQALAVNWLAVAGICLLTAILAFLPLIPAVRRGVARLLPIDAASTVHTTALAFAVYQLGLSLAQMALIGDLETLIEAEMVLTIWDVLLTGVPMVLLALLGVGLFMRRGWRETAQRLGLLRPTWKQLLAAVVVTALLLGLDMGVNYVWENVDPLSYDLVDRVAENMFGGLATVAGALVLGLSAGISEELLFRGAVQPRLGLIVATVLFTIGHLQYGLTLATLEVFIIGLVLGLMRKRTSVTICILIHASYNAVGVILGMV